MDIHVLISIELDRFQKGTQTPQKWKDKLNKLQSGRRTQKEISYRQSPNTVCVTESGVREVSLVRTQDLTESPSGIQSV